MRRGPDAGSSMRCRRSSASFHLVGQGRGSSGSAPGDDKSARASDDEVPHFDPEATPRLWSVACLGALVMASALYSTPSVPSEAPDQRSGPGVAAAPLAPVDATLEPSNPPPPPVLQVRRHSQRRDVWRTSHASPPVLPWMRPAALVALAHRHWSPLPSPSAPMRTRRRSSSSNLCWCAPHLATCHPFLLALPKTCTHPCARLAGGCGHRVCRGRAPPDRATAHAHASDHEVSSATWAGAASQFSAHGTPVGRRVRCRCRLVVLPADSRSPQPRRSGYAMWPTVTTHCLAHLPPASSPARLVWQSAMQAPS